VTRKAKKAAMPGNTTIISLCWQLATHSGNGIEDVMEKGGKMGFCYTTKPQDISNPLIDIHSDIWDKFPVEAAIQ